ncbi:hypothetical protein BJ684DRAFT_21239 [Piptocephalis cylindrospora]|uniref:Uncharacterized protein n=1 Tax=Piptocephalis cylindrospora TaxID=1907219 RepID=A0A4P9Y0G5_9FUNG|nr:hypothetical protein BJ684DRAFT_21239 [Piptocephalis cylindrospora]|eukprot:RKP12207.1 hypothetical protein BJ684DRAFT_21239 [Piptocephalis cylindrospora]
MAKEREEGGSLTLDDYLSFFNFEESDVIPAGCNNLHAASYGYSEGHEEVPKRVRMESVTLPHHVPVEAQIDVDSVLWNVEELCIKVPLTIYPNPNRFENIKLNHQYVKCPGLEKPVPMGRTPHCLFGRARDSLAVHVIFPNLAPDIIPPGQDFLTNELLKLWYDKVIYQAFIHCLDSFKLQHIRSSWDNSAELDVGASIGHTLPAPSVRAITKKMREIVEADEDLCRRFGDFFFHAAFKGKKMTTSVPLSQLDNDEGFQAWRRTIHEEYTSIFGQEGIDGMMVDVGVEFIGSREMVEEYGPIHLTWKMDESIKMGLGITKAPRRMEWWLTGDLGGCVFDVGPSHPVCFQGNRPNFSYVQLYQLDKERLSGKTKHWMGRLDLEDMSSNNSRFMESYEILKRGIVEGFKQSSGVRFEGRMTSRLFLESANMGGFLTKCKEVMEEPSQYMQALPSLTAWRFKAVNLWLIMDGVRRVDLAQSGPETEAYRMVLASAYRGLYRGVYFSYHRAIVFGPRTRPKATSYGLSWASTNYNIAYRSRRLIDCVRGRARLEGLEGVVGASIEGATLELPDIMGPREKQVISPRVCEGGVENPEEIAASIMALLRQDMLNSSLKYQSGPSMTSWSLAQVRLAIPRRAEFSIGSRRSIKTWKKLFRYFFPERRTASQEFNRRTRWTRVGYMEAYLTALRVLQSGESCLPVDTSSRFDSELWRLFQQLDCSVRSLERKEFAHAHHGLIYIDLREEEQPRSELGDER